MALFTHNGYYFFNFFGWYVYKELSKMKHFFEGFRKGSVEFGYTLTVTINSILLSLVYLIGVGLTSLFAKLIGKHFLENKVSKTLNTYWSDLNLKDKKFEEYYRQF